jgi:hypothetical protein
MKSYILDIANYKIRLESVLGGPDLAPSTRFRKYISNETGCDLLLRVHKGMIKPDPGMRKVFSAPYIKEIDGIPTKINDEFWSVYSDRNFLYIESLFPSDIAGKKGILRLSAANREWDLFLEGCGKITDPLEYPLDGLLLYYLTASHGDIFIHASGVNFFGKGYIFSGISGKGKTTMANIWGKYGGRIIHDDRLIVRKSAHGFSMHNTPVLETDEPSESVVNKIFIIEHGNKNRLIPLSGAQAVSNVIANCIQHNWDRKMIFRLMTSVSLLCDSVPVAKLPFIPDDTIIDFIRGNA